ncbi:hypothetical protein OAA16_00425 [Candidatus Pelagibacter sp.]|nr:hypothetical protein [Candidatus Pelagibacter sp.]
MSLLSAIGGLVGLAFGGPMGAALGSGIGTLASGGDIGDALKSGVMGYGIGSLPGVSGLAAKGAGMMGMQGMAGQFAAQQAAQQAALGKIAPGVMKATAPIGDAISKIGTGVKAGSGIAPAAQGSMGQGLFGSGMMDNLLLASLMQAGEPKETPLTPLQKRQVATGERLPDYQGTAAPDYRRGIATMMNGGYIEGPGTGKSDSIPAAIYQDGGRVQEARLSDGEFVMTADAVKGAGGGNRNAGAAKMYQMMNQFERRA